jgi:hypothetical protein
MAAEGLSRGRMRRLKCIHCDSLPATLNSVKPAIPSQVAIIGFLFWVSQFGFPLHDLTTHFIACIHCDKPDRHDLCFLVRPDLNSDSCCRQQSIGKTGWTSSWITKSPRSLIHFATTLHACSTSQFVASFVPPRSVIRNSTRNTTTELVQYRGSALWW